jgi:hypothetical protein
MQPVNLAASPIFGSRLQCQDDDELLKLSNDVRDLHTRRTTPEALLSGMMLPESTQSQFAMPSQNP